MINVDIAKLVDKAKTFICDCLKTEYIARRDDFHHLQGSWEADIDNRGDISLTAVAAAGISVAPKLFAMTEIAMRDEAFVLRRAAVRRGRHLFPAQVLVGLLFSIRSIQMKKSRIF